MEGLTVTSRLHATSGVISLIAILSFWVSTLFSELVLSHEAVTVVKHSILYGLSILIPAMAVTGASGMSLSKSRSGKLVDLKKKRMRILSINGIMVMVPAAVFLYWKADAGEFDMAFFSVQIVELVVGGIQLTLLTMNFRDGLRLAGRFTDKM